MNSTLLMIYAGAITLIALTAAVTALGAFLLWRDGFRKGWRRAREKPPTCLRCGYNMSGLWQCRCPECGVEYKLDQLWRTPVVGFGSPEPGLPDRKPEVSE